MTNSAERPILWVSWSSGKDSSWALHALRQAGEYEITSLLTTVNERYDRVAMHAVREELLGAQAEALGLPLFKVYIPSPCPHEVYETKMREAVSRAREEGVSAMAFGDLYLEDIRAYRVEKLEGTGISPIFPIWGIDTSVLAREMVDSGLLSYITAVDPKLLDASFAGRVFDSQFLDDLPEGVDPCGENGEFHSFAFQGPMFRHPVPVQPGEVVERDGFVFADVLPG